MEAITFLELSAELEKQMDLFHIGISLFIAGVFFFINCKY